MSSAPCGSPRAARHTRLRGCAHPPARGCADRTAVAARRCGEHAARGGHGNGRGARAEGKGRGNATDLAARPEGQLLLDEIDELGAADQSVAVGVGFAEAPSQLRLRRPRIGSRPSAHNSAAATPPRPRPRASWCALLLRNTLRLRARAHARACACVRALVRVRVSAFVFCVAGVADRLDSS